MQEEFVNLTALQIELASRVLAALQMELTSRVILLILLRVNTVVAQNASTEGAHELHV